MLKGLGGGQVPSCVQPEVQEAKDLPAMHWEPHPRPLVGAPQRVRLLPGGLSGPAGSPAGKGQEMGRWSLE